MSARYVYAGVSPKCRCKLNLWLVWRPSRVLCVKCPSAPLTFKCTKCCPLRKSLFGTLVPKYTAPHTLIYLRFSHILCNMLRCRFLSSVIVVSVFLNTILRFKLCITVHLQPCSNISTLNTLSRATVKAAAKNILLASVAHALRCIDACNEILITC